MKFPFRNALLPSILTCLHPILLSAQPEAFDAPTPIDLRTAIHLAAQSDPRLQLNAANAEAAEGRIEQAGFRPNPVLGTEIENFLGSGPIHGTRSLEITLGVRQLVETAGKREKRVALARSERDLIEWERDQVLSQIESAVREKFISVLLAMETTQLRREQVALAKESEVETRRMVEAARAPEVELTRARLAVQQQSFYLKQAENALASARIELANTWGESGPSVFVVQGGILLADALPGLDELTDALPMTTPLAQFDSMESMGEAALAVEQAQAKPDLEVFGGARYFNENDGDMGFVMGIEIPWPLFDKNQGNISAARARLKAVQQAREAARRELVNQLNVSYQEMVSARHEAIMVSTELLPMAESTLAETKELYLAGSSNQLAVLEARSMLFQFREMRLDAMSRFALASARVEALTRRASPKP